VDSLLRVTGAYRSPSPAVGSGTALPGTACGELAKIALGRLYGLISEGPLPAITPARDGAAVKGCLDPLRADLEPSNTEQPGNELKSNRYLHGLMRTARPTRISTLYLRPGPAWKHDLMQASQVRAWHTPGVGPLKELPTRSLT
jgi:hypothetical protein